ncbi:ankyrin [Lophiostoma macrostomum CBS 122681]|uniref:Ankyrin n=1 Tax=Lophiostoma macrostomum CBS 122681 TaxID=1314788 RepID=A0A6A6TL45_9PLEO|nr:ankyrin [Lophiostoma macrostomum CBS 122681]
MVEKLLAAGALSDKRTSSGSTPLHYAAASGSRRISEMLLETYDRGTNTVDGAGHTALFYAVINGYYDVVELLIKQGNADPNCHDPREFSTTAPPLTQAILLNDFRMMQILLEAGADANIQYEGLPAFYNVARQGKGELINLMVKHVAILDLYDSDLRKENISLSTTRYLYDLFVEHGIDLNVQDQRKQTLLMLAAADGHMGVCQLLLDRPDVDVTVVDKYGENAADHARVSKHWDVANMLQNKMTAATRPALEEHPGLPSSDVTIPQYTQAQLNAYSQQYQCYPPQPYHIFEDVLHPLGIGPAG